MAIIETLTTETHHFYIADDYFGRSNTHPGFRAEYRPLNPKTGKPWQASRSINEQADIAHPGYEGRPNAYSTVELAQAAIERQIAKLAKGRK